MAKMKLPNGFGNISKLGGKRRNPWRARVNDGFTEDGKVKWLSIGYYKSYNDAYNALNNYHNDPLSKTKDITLGEVYEIVTEKVFPIYAANTAKQYRNFYNLHLSVLHNRKIREITLDELEDILFMKSDGNQRVIKNVMTMIFSYAMRHDYLIKDYSQLIDLRIIPKAETKEQERRPFTEKEIERVWNDYHEGNELAKYVLVYLYTGMRREELNAITIVDKNNMIVDGTKTPNAKNRKIPIHDKLKPFIHTLDLTIDTELVFDYVKSFKQLLHNCRHSFITQARRLELNDIYIKAITGHGDKTITDRYTHIKFEDLTPTMKKFHY